MATDGSNDPTKQAPTDDRDVDATPWAGIDGNDAVDAAPVLAKPLIAAPEAVAQPISLKVVNPAGRADKARGESVPQMSVRSADVTPTEDDLQVAPVEVERVNTANEKGSPAPVGTSQDVDDPVLRIGQMPAADVMRREPLPPSREAWWTIPTLCAGLAIVACSLVVPQADANRRLVWEREKLTRDLESTRKQVEVNDAFLKRVADDANLAERLAQRQMKMYRQGTAILDLRRSSKDEMSPFLLTAVVPPSPVAAYQPRGGTLAMLFLSPRYSLYLSGVGLMLIAIGLVMSGEPVKPKDAHGE